MTAINDTDNYRLEFPVNGREAIMSDMYRKNVKKIDRALKMEQGDRQEADTAIRGLVSALTQRVADLEERVAALEPSNGGTSK